MGCKVLAVVNVKITVLWMRLCSVADISVLEEPAACVFRVEDRGKQIRLKYWYLYTTLHGVIFQKALM